MNIVLEDLPWGPGSPGGPGNPSLPGGPGLPWAWAASIAAGSLSWDRNTAILSSLMKGKIIHHVTEIFCMSKVFKFVSHEIQQKLIWFSTYVHLVYQLVWLLRDFLIVQVKQLYKVASTWRQISCDNERLWGPSAIQRCCQPSGQRPRTWLTSVMTCGENSGLYLKNGCYNKFKPLSSNTVNVPVVI